FQPILIGKDTCRTITLRNQQTTGDIDISSVRIVGSAQGGMFTMTPDSLRTVLHPNDSVTLQFCYTPRDTSIVSIDTIIVHTACVTYSYILRGSGVTPLIYATDALF